MPEIVDRRVAARAPAAGIADNRGGLPRFYAPAGERVGDAVDLPPDEAAHLARVLRLAAGAAVRVFNGRGLEFLAVIDSVARSRVRVRLDAAAQAAPEPRVAVTLGQSVLKGDRMGDAIRDAVMMGASAIQPVVADRSEVPVSALRRGHRRERWQRIAVASAKQCGRAIVPPILEPRLFGDVAAAVPHMSLPGPAFMFVEPSAAASPLELREITGPPPREATILIGPEGGWTPEEIDRGSAACHLVTLGARTLRSDAMAIVAMTALFTVWREF